MAAKALFYRAVLVLGILGLTVAIPYALHQLVVVDTAGDAVIRLHGYDVSVASNKVRSQIPRSTDNFQLFEYCFLTIFATSLILLPMYYF